MNKYPNCQIQQILVLEFKFKGYQFKSASAFPNIVERKNLIESWTQRWSESKNPEKVNKPEEEKKWIIHK